MLKLNQRIIVVAILSLGVLCGMFVSLADCAAAKNESPRKPNVVLVMTDDQGYGDLACHGNRMIQTPNLDALSTESVRFTNFHVDPTCAETRSALMTGRYSSRVGVWHTIMGRSLLRRGETTMAEVFAASGYRTGVFGKWHLGDNYPFRPQDRGFQEVLINGGGGVTQTPDYWGNDYFDDTYFHNGKPEPQQGYCTDVFFNAGMDFIEANKDRPFFCYIPTNAPHGPFNVAAKYSDPYVEQGVPQQMANFYGMITNIDENMARLRAKLRELDLDRNTILIFMTDNGTAAGAGRGKPKPGQWPGFNANMRAQKGSQYEGGHRVPCFVRWPAGGIEGDRNIHQLAAHFDLLPTLAELCHLKTPANLHFDGKSLAPLLQGTTNWKPRTLFVHSQRVDIPEKWRKCSVMTQRWRMVDGKELYAITDDPGQKTDIASQHPEVVAKLRKQYEAWWADISTRFDEYCEIVLGAPQENPSWLTCHDWHAPISQVPWNHRLIEKGPLANGFWAVDVQRSGVYQITLRRWPLQKSGPLPGIDARIKIGDLQRSAPIPSGAESIMFEVPLKAGKTRLQTWLTEADGKSRGAFYLQIQRTANP